MDSSGEDDFITLVICFAATLNVSMITPRFWEIGLALHARYPKI